MFSEGYCNQQIKVIEFGSSKDSLQVLHKVHRKGPWKQACHQNCITIPLCVTELICSLVPNRSGRYTVFWYADGKMINDQSTWCMQLGRHQRISHSSGITWQKHQNFHWKITKSTCAGDIEFGKKSTMRHLDTCFNNVETFINTMQYCYDNMIALHLVHTNKKKFKKSKGGEMKTSVKSRNDRFYL